MNTQPSQDNLLKFILFCGGLAIFCLFLAGVELVTGLTARLIPTGEGFLLVLACAAAALLWGLHRANLPDHRLPAEEAAPAPSVSAPASASRHRTYVFGGATPRPALRRKIID